MKKFTFFLLLTNALPLFAYSSTLIDQPDDFRWNPSKNYQKKLINDDGSVTFVEPRYSTLGGQDILISTKSNHRGVCYHLGKTWHVYTQTHRSDYPGQRVSMASFDLRGRMKGLKRHKLESDNSIRTITCASELYMFDPARIKKTRKNYTKLIVNGDGSRTIVGPKFKFMGLNHAMSGDYSKSLKNICKYFGYREYVYGSATYWYNGYFPHEVESSRTIAIDQSGRFKSLKRFRDGVSSLTYTY